jgi:hypothetical protein
LVDELDDAIDHTTDIARKHTPSEVWVHRLDGRVQRLAALEYP